MSAAGPAFPGATGLVQMRDETGVRFWHGAPRHRDRDVPLGRRRARTDAASVAEQRLDLAEHLLDAVERVPGRLGVEAKGELHVR